jgi:catechol 2,3-dioxygenase-like lactoylglutathione lyase family enzyme
MLQHASLEVRSDQVQPCVDFWHLLGFVRMTPPPMLRDRFTWVERAGTHIHLIPTDEPIAAREGHVAVLAEDYEGALAALRDAGFEPEPRKEHWGAARSFVLGPAGHRVEVMAGSPARL